MIRVDRPVYDDVLAHARSGAPEEVCGVLGGDYGGSASHVRTSRRTANAADAPRVAYAIDPAEQFAAMEAIEDERHQVVGFYHSHPAGPDGPSATDAARATWTGYSYVVATRDDATEFDLGSWRWTGERFEREELRVD